MNNILNNLKFKIYNRFTFEENGKKYYFKKFDTTDRSLDYLYNELIAYKLASKVNINCIEPSILTKKNIIGIVTESFDLDNYNKINGYKIILEYYEYLKKSNQIDYENLEEAEILAKMNNLEDIWNALDYHFRNYDIKLKNKIINQIMSELTKMFSFDIITMQIDRHSENWEILESKDKTSAFLAPLYDNELAFNTFVDNSSIKTEYEVGRSLTAIQRLKKYLNISSDYFVKEFINMFNELSPKILEEIIEECNNECNYIIPYTYKERIIKIYIKNYEKIKNLLLELNLIEKSEGHAR